MITLPAFAKLLVCVCAITSAPLSPSHPSPQTPVPSTILFLTTSYTTFVLLPTLTMWTSNVLLLSASQNSVKDVSCTCVHDGEELPVDP